MKIEEINASDFILAYKILKDLATSWDKFEAYKLKLIDDKGKKLKNAETDKEKDSVDSYYRIIFNMKRLASKMLGNSKLSRAAVTLLLLKENVNTLTIDIINKNLDYPDMIDNEFHISSLVESSIVEF